MFNQNYTSKLKYFLSIFLLVAFSLLFTQKTYAATLSISPSSVDVSVGKTVTVKVFVNTLDKSINNAEATILFPTDLLSVTSIGKSSSIFSLWVEEPKFSNSTGTITFNGGVPNPGFSGSNGYIASVTFKAKKKGTASILFSDGAVRENDGLGTNILTSKNGSVIQIKTAKVVEAPVKVIEPPVTVVKDIVPNKIMFSPSIRFEGNQGIVKLSDETNISNINYYTLAIDDGPSFKVKKDQLVNYEYYIPILNQGSHAITIIDFDDAGRYKESIITFLSPDISVPILSLSSNEIITGDSVVIYGKTNYPNSRVNVILELDKKEIKRYEQVVGVDGSFSITTDKIKNVGNLNIWAENILSDNVKSGISEKIYLKVNESNFFKITMTFFYPVIWLLSVLTIILLLLIFLYLGWHKFFKLKKRFENETKEVAIKTHKAMSVLKEELHAQLGMLKKIKVDGNLNKEEELIFSEIEKNIDTVDSFIENK